MNFSNLTDRALATELVKRSKKDSIELNEDDKKHINYMTWAMGDSPKIRACLEHMLEIIMSLSSEHGFKESVICALEMNALLTQYDGLYLEKRLERIEKHLGIEINFEE